MNYQERLTPNLYLFLSTAIEILGADKGNVQFYDERKKTLKIVAHIGFNDEFLKVFESVAPGFAACGAALKSGEKILIEDTSQDPVFKDIGSTSKRFGYSAVISIPLLDSYGKLFGIISAHFKKTHRPSEKELETLDRYLQSAMPIIERKRRESISTDPSKN